jgi:hypothetical protein
VYSIPPSASGRKACAAGWEEWKFKLAVGLHTTFFLGFAAVAHVFSKFAPLWAKTLECTIGIHHPRWSKFVYAL